MEKAMLGSALREVCGPLGDFLLKLSGGEGQDWWRAFKRFLRREDPFFFPLVSEENGVFFLSLTSRGHSGPKWVEVLRGKEPQLHNQEAEDFLLSPDFVHTPEGYVHNLVVVRARHFESSLWKDQAALLQTAMQMRIHGLPVKQASPEVACLIRETWSPDQVHEAFQVDWLVSVHPYEGCGNLSSYGGFNGKDHRPPPGYNINVAYVFEV